MGQFSTPRASSGGLDTGSLCHFRPPCTLPNAWPRPRQPLCWSKGYPPRGWAYSLSSAIAWPRPYSFPSLAMEGTFLPNGPHSEQVGCLLAQGLEIVYEPFHLHPIRHPGNRGPPSLSQLTADPQEAPRTPLCALLPPGSQTRHCPSPPVNSDTLPLPPRHRL